MSIAVCAVVGLLASTGSGGAGCGAVAPLEQRALLAPRAGTFYSVDALNPDVVRWGGRYLMYFSGNDTHSPAGRWRTGLAVARSPLGPFAVSTLSRPYLNGGTVAWRGRLWQATWRSSGTPDGVLLSSPDGMHWSRVAAIPQHVGPYLLTADYSLQVVQGRLRLWAIGRTNPPALASRIFYMAWQNYRWGRPVTVAAPGRQAWNAIDLGEPKAISTDEGGGSLLAYVGTATAPFVRSVGVGFATATGWRLCSTPLIPAGAAPWGRAVSIDPSLLREGGRIYVYYGGGTGTRIASDLRGAIGVGVYDAGRLLRGPPRCAGP
ncbi:MAG: hypothetical protein ACXVSX_13475 [Solirubrobacteraceae bacterium]